MWEISAFVGVLEQRGLCVRQDLLGVNHEGHRRLIEGAGGIRPLLPPITLSPTPQYASAFMPPRTHHTWPLMKALLKMPTLPVEKFMSHTNSTSMAPPDPASVVADQ